MRVLCIFLLLSSVVVAQVAQYKLLIRYSIDMMQKFKVRFNFMETSIDQMIVGLTNAYHLQITDDQIRSIGPYLTDITARLQSLPPNAADLVPSNKVFGLLSPMSSLKRLFPTSPAALNANVIAYGGPAGLFTAAIPFINTIISKLQPN